MSRRNTMRLLGTTIGIGTGSSFLLTGNAQAATSAVTLKKQNRNSDLRGEPEYCAVDSATLEEIGAEVGEQIRAGATTDGAKYESALYTVIGDGTSRDTIGMGKAGFDRLDLKKDSPGFGRSHAPSPDYETRAEAEHNDEYVEILVDNSQQSKLVACAVHGGWIEYRTDEQAEYVAETLDVTEWSCAGYNSGGGAYDRWHITSTDISRHSFPRLDSIADRQFTHAVSFHGFSEDGIRIGGRAPDSLKQDVRDEIDDATGGRYDVSLASDGDYDGDSSENFVNWLTADGSGVQVEQEWDARTDDWDTIAEAVSRVYADRI